MTAVIIGAIIGGIVSGAVSGAATSSLYIRRSSSAQASKQSAAATGFGSQSATANQSGQVAIVRRGSLVQTYKQAGSERGVQLTAKIIHRTNKGLPSQVLIISNLGDRPAEELVVRPSPEGGGFIVQPNWSEFVRMLAAGQSADLPCVTSGVGRVTFITSFTDSQSPQGPLMIEATHG